ncbi:hypothetical protein [Isoptericola sp. BMS4]|uniref:hypothetical protein n=1 Tax=Isoptericola sp. BMS4 TaxID=2527875 RepID=UPI00142122D9|nr:hypothetical protein [Isoptericola sp. BMS4]
MAQAQGTQGEAPRGAGSAARPRRHLVRRWVAGVLVVVTTLLFVGSSVALWAHRTVLDTDRFMATVEPVLDDPAFYDALSETVSEQTLVVLDLDTRVSTRLEQLDEVVAGAVAGRLADVDRPLLEGLLDRVDRPSLAALTPVVVDRLEGRVETIVDRLVHSDAFVERLPLLVERAHAGAMGLARGDVADYPNVYLTDDALMLDTLPIVGDALREVVGEFGDLLPDVTLPDVISERADDARAQLSEALGEQIPADAGQVRLMDREVFDTVQQSVRVADRAVVALVLVTVLLAAATLAVAPSTRRGAVQLGLGVLAGLLLTTALIGQLRGLVVDVARQPDGRHVAGVLFDTVSGGLHDIFWLVGIVAAGGVVAALLVGSPRWLDTAARRYPWVRTATGRDGRLPRWVAARADLLRVVVAVLAALVVVVTGFAWVALVLVVLGAGLALWGISAASRLARVPGGSGADEPPAPAAQR